MAMLEFEEAETESYFELEFQELEYIFIKSI